MCSSLTDNGVKFDMLAGNYLADMEIVVKFVYSCQILLCILL